MYGAGPGKAGLLLLASLSRHAAVELSHRAVRKPRPRGESREEFVGLCRTAAGMGVSKPPGISADRVEMA